MTINKVSFALFPAIKPKSKVFTGGWITDIDLLTLDEAAAMATKHAGSEVTPNDFLRAAGRGKIELIALVRKETKFKYLDSPELEAWITEGGGWRLPLQACQDLANKGFARWRTQEDVEPHRGSYMQYRTTICITDDEPDLKAEPSDCRVIGHYVHALADAFRPQAKPEPQQSSEPAPMVADSAKGSESWKVKARERADEIIKRRRASDYYPSQKNIADEIASEFRTGGIMGAGGKPLTGAYIKRHALKGISSAQGRQLSTSIRRGK